MGKQNGDLATSVQITDDFIYEILVHAEVFLKTSQIKIIAGDKYKYCAVAQSLRRLTKANLIIKHQVPNRQQNMFKVGAQIVQNNSKIDQHPLSVYWPVKVYVPRGTPRKPHRCQIMDEETA